MNGYGSIDDFINSPNTVDFVIQQSDSLSKYVENNPYILLTREVAGGFVLGYIDRKDIDRAIAALGSSFISAEARVMGLLDMESLEASGILQAQQDPNLNLTGKGVLFGIVDTGIDYTLNVFRHEDGTTRIVSIYDQTVPSPYSSDLIIGTEYTREQINEALASEDPLSIVPSNDTVGHGTFLASVAVGSRIDGFTVAAPDSELIVVKLRKARPYYLERYCVPPEQENAFSSSAVIFGIDYIIRKALELNRPVAICIGLGSSFGSRDGFSILAQYISFIAQQIGVCICIAVGNESQAGHHFSGKLNESGDIQPIQLVVGENAGCVFLNMWNPVSDVMSVSFQSPSGVIVPPIRAKASVRYSSALGTTRVSVEYYTPVRITGDQSTLIWLYDLTPGVWTIKVHGDSIHSGEFHIYLPLTGFVSPQVYFENPDPYYTLTLPAAAFGAIDTGAYNTATNELMPESSWGPSRVYFVSPDFVAPGVNVGGFFPDGYGKMSGTSVAAAITTGACCQILQWGIVDGNNITLSTYQIRAYLILGTSHLPGISYPNFQWGYGTLNITQSFNIIRGFLPENPNTNG